MSPKKSSEIMSSLEKFLRSWTREKVKNELEGFDRGTGTPHILFNYLDFLIWEKIITTENWDDARKGLGLELIDLKEGLQAESFEFAFRNSVEHFFPSILINPILLLSNQNILIHGQKLVLQEKREGE